MCLARRQRSSWARIKLFIKWFLNQITLNLNRCILRHNRLRPVNYFLEFLKCFPHSKRVLQVLLIVQFSRSSASHRFREAAYLLYRIRCCLSTRFCDFFRRPFRWPAGAGSLPGAQDSIIRACGSKVNPLFPIFLIFPSAHQNHGPKRPSLYII